MFGRRSNKGPSGRPVPTRKELFERIEALEAKVAELEAKRVPVISDLTGGGKKEKPVTAKQIIDEWLNGKREGGDG